MKTEIVLITPALAKDWLATHGRQRNLREMKVAQYADEIRRGAWRLTHQGIAFGNNGELIDGQHRLSAIVRANIGVLISVTWGVDGGYDLPIDTGAVRKVADVVGLHRTTVAMITMLHRLRDGMRDTTGTVPPSIVEEVFKQERAHCDAVSKLIMSGGGKFRVSAAAGAGIAYVRPLNALAIDEFVDRILSGANLAKGSPALTFREWYVVNGHGSGRDSSMASVLAGLRASWGHIRGEVLSKMFTSRTTGLSWCTRAYADVSSARRARGLVAPTSDRFAPQPGSTRPNEQGA